MINSIVMLTQNSTIIIGDIAKIFGVIMDTIYNVFSSIGIESLGVSIIIFTILVRVLMLPLAFKQQKSMKEMQKIQPQLKKLQEKYKNKKDPEQQQKYQMEMNKLYKEHNVSPFGGCLPLLVQFPIIMSLFQVLRNIPAYIGTVKDLYSGIATNVVNAEGAGTFLTDLAASGSTAVKDFDLTNIDKVIDVIGKFSTDQWTTFIDQFGSTSSIIGQNYDKITEIYMFFGTINLADKPDLMSVAILLPVLNVVVQFMSTKASMENQSGEQNQTQKSMMYTMPLITAFFVATMPAGLGLYWLASSMFQWGQQVVINKHLHSDEKDTKEIKEDKNISTKKLKK